LNITYNQIHQTKIHAVPDSTQLGIVDSVKQLDYQIATGQVADKDMPLGISYWLARTWR